MKNRFLTFIIGILTGAIIMTLIFLVINKSNNDYNMNNIPPNGEMQRPNDIGERPQKPEGNKVRPEL